MHLFHGWFLDTQKQSFICFSFFSSFFGKWQAKRPTTVAAFFFCEENVCFCPWSKSSANWVSLHFSLSFGTWINASVLASLIGLNYWEVALMLLLRMDVCCFDVALAFGCLWRRRKEKKRKGKKICLGFA